MPLLESSCFQIAMIQEKTEVQSSEEEENQWKTLWNGNRISGGMLQLTFFTSFQKIILTQK